MSPRVRSVPAAPPADGNGRMPAEPKDSGLSPIVEASQEYDRAGVHPSSLYEERGREPGDVGS
jgi:hypothetical protein